MLIYEIIIDKTMENTKNASLSKLVPVMLCFFAMGFVDLVGRENFCRNIEEALDHADKMLEK